MLNLNGVEFYGHKVVIKEAKTCIENEKENSLWKEDSSDNGYMPNDSADDEIIVETVVQPHRNKSKVSISYGYKNRVIYYK